MADFHFQTALFIFIVQMLFWISCKTELLRHWSFYLAQSRILALRIREKLSLVLYFILA